MSCLNRPLSCKTIPMRARLCIKLTKQLIIKVLAIATMSTLSSCASKGHSHLTLASHEKGSSDVAVTIYDSSGRSARSTRDGLLNLILFAPHTIIHLKISNTTKKALTLWAPYCPQGDSAMAIEFRYPRARDKVFQAHTSRGYTCSMGFPKVMTLAPGDDLLVNVDFLSEWTLPFPMKAGEERELEARAVYQSTPLTVENIKRSHGSKQCKYVWTGVATSLWNKIIVSNRTGAAIKKL